MRHASHTQALHFLQVLSINTDFDGCMKLIKQVITDVVYSTNVYLSLFLEYMIWRPWAGMLP